jgi:small conductance mechanosensitive channel
MEKYLDQLTSMIVEYGPKLLGAIIVLLIGLQIIKIIAKNLNKLFDKSNIDVSLKPFLKSLISAILKVLLIISVMGMVGIEMTSFIAILGAAGLAIGMALSGTLQNFAGGVLILLLKPYKVGDFIETNGYLGSVKEIQIFYTILNTVDKKQVIIPNAKISNESLTNFTAEELRRVDFSFGIGYDDDFEKAKSIIAQLINAHEKTLKDPEPFIRVGELADSSVNITTRVWVKAEDYWTVHFDMIENVKKEFDQQGISIPYPQTDVHVHNVK